MFGRFQACGKKMHVTFREKCAVMYVLDLGYVVTSIRYRPTTLF
jgi:hypothetical protein